MRMADKHSLNLDVRELKLGASFTNKNAPQYHTIKYDFKPASVDVNKMATVDVGANHQVTVTVPHLDGAGVTQTVFKGSQRPATKECVLIIDRVTGEVTLEKLSTNILVKKTRQESAAKPRPLTPVTSELTNTTQRSSSRTRVATNRRGPHAAPGVPGAGASVGRAGGAAAGAGVGAGAGTAPKHHNNMVRSPPRQRTSPPQAAPWSGGGNSTLASLPMIGLDDALGPPPAPYSQPQARHDRPERPDRPDRPERQDRPDRPDKPERPDRQERPDRPERPERQDRPERAFMPDRHPVVQPHVPPPASRQEDSSSSSSSESGSDSDSSDSEDGNTHTAHLTNGNASVVGVGVGVGGAAAAAALPSDVLNDDLCLSESGSDSD